MIDEKRLIKRFIQLKGSDSLANMFINDVIREINNQPKIGEWIPCSERLPNKDEYLKDDGRFIVTDGNRRYQSHYDIYDGNFNTCDFSIDNCVIAWQPLPDAYIGKHKECD